MKRITASQSSAHRGSNVKNTVISTVCSTTQAAKTWKKVIRLSITDPLWGESTDAQWKHPTESQKCEKHSSCNFYDITEMLIAHRTADRSTFGKQVLMSSVLEMIFTIPCISFICKYTLTSERTTSGSSGWSKCIMKHCLPQNGVEVASMDYWKKNKYCV